MKRGPNESKVTLFTIGTDFLASRFNVTINERNLMFEKKKRKHEFGGLLKGPKRASTKHVHMLINFFDFFPTRHAYLGRHVY